MLDMTGSTFEENVSLNGAAVTSSSQHNF
jgi:hypothetical protein